MKNSWKHFLPDSPLRVLLHGIHRKRRGRRNSATAMGEENPRLAFKKAKNFLEAAAVMLLAPWAKEYPVEVLLQAKWQLELAFPFEMRMGRFEGYRRLEKLLQEAEKRRLDKYELAFLADFRREIDRDRQSFSNPDDGEEGAYTSCVDDLNRIDDILTKA